MSWIDLIILCLIELRTVARYCDIVIHFGPNRVQL